VDVHNGDRIKQERKEKAKEQKERQENGIEYKNKSYKEG
jgi:hypothetical protein